KEGRAAVQEALRQHLAGAAKPADAVQRSLANLKEVSDILNAKAPQDAAGFKAWLQAIGQNVADASSEGGFLGIGGVKVSDAEKATLDDISKSLGPRAYLGGPLGGPAILLGSPLRSDPKQTCALLLKRTSPA